MGAAHDALVAAIGERLSARSLSARAAALGAGLPERRVQGVLEGHTPSIDNAAEICAALGLEFYIGPPRGNPPPSEAEIEPDDLRASPPPLPVGGALDVQPWPVPVDGPWFAPIGCAVFGARFLRRAEIEPPHCLTVPVADDSMVPTIPKGTFVLADKRRQELAADRLFLVRWEGRHHVRRAKASRELVADNPKWPEAVDHNAKIVGQVVWYARLLIDLKSIEEVEAA